MQVLHAGAAGGLLGNIDRAAASPFGQVFCIGAAERRADGMMIANRPRDVEPRTAEVPGQIKRRCLADRVDQLGKCVIAGQAV